MYLFLTAMLAINVSNEVLEAFTIIDNGIVKTIQTFEEKNDQMYASFEQAYRMNPSKVASAREQALVVRQKSDSLFRYIKDLKQIIVQKADGPEADVNNIKKKDNIDVAAEVMIVNRNGTRLRKAIESYREYILSRVSEEDSTLRHAMMETLDTSHPPAKDGAIPTWESHQFGHIPLAGAVTLLTKLQSDIRNTESDVINYIYNQIEAESYKFNKLNAEVFAKSNYVLKGDEYEAEIFLAAQDTTLTPRIYLNNGTQITKFKDGKGIFRVKANEVGEKEWGGVIRYRTPSGKEQRYTFSSKYLVAEPNVVVSPTKMNVFYVGVDNPVSISVPGIPMDRIRARMTNGKISKNGNAFVVRPDIPFRVAKITVDANFDGEYKPLKSVDFRVKPIPDPVAKVAGKNGGSIKKNILLAQTGVDAVLDNFDFDLKFKITGFTVSTIVKGYTRDETSRSDMFTREQIALLKTLTRNKKVYIEDIRAEGPDGETRKLPAISFRIK